MILSNLRESFMPIETAIFVVAIAVVFIGFGLVLRWGERQTRDLHRN